MTKDVDINLNIAQSAQSPFAAEELPHFTILVVDDEPVNIQLINQILGKAYRVLMATNGHQAIERCKTHKPDLILLDVMMPNLDGLETCKLIKSDSQIADIPVIFVTAANQQEDENACWQAGGIDFIQKPINPTTLTHRVRAHLKLKHQTDLLRSMAFIDGLTAVHNRRYFEYSLDEQFRLSKRQNTPLTLMLIDVDFFKRYNDIQGHLAGDDVLREIAQTLKNCCKRPTDVVSRYGGEEFAILLPATDSDGAKVVADVILTAIATRNLPHPDSVMPFVTVSIGIACSKQEAPNTLIDAADKQLYLAKETGRNRYKLDVQSNTSDTGPE